MLDVHPPHHAATTWRDFFIHIATIVIGLLIAVGLEQTVEWVHHRHQLAEAREQLRTEYRANLVIYRYQRQECQRYIAVLQRDMAIFQYISEHPNSPPTAWPGEISFYYASPTFQTSAWRSLETSGTLARMPREELDRETTLYRWLDALGTEQREVRIIVYKALRFGVRNQAPESLTPAEARQVQDALTDVLSKYAEMLQLQRNLSVNFPDFQPAGSQADVQAIIHLISPAKDHDTVDAAMGQMVKELATVGGEKQ